MTEAEKAYQYFVIAVPENEEQAKAYFWARKVLQPTHTPPNKWVSVYDRLPEPGERVLATDCGFVGEFYINKRGKWQRYNVNCSELLMALDILYWMPLPAPPDRRPPEEPLTCEGCVHEYNEHENCNYCERASYLGDYYCRRPQDGEKEKIFNE